MENSPRIPTIPRPLRGWAAILPLVLAGCGGSGDVSGTVRLGGKPLPGGRVTFHAQDKSTSPVSAPINADGTYRLDRCPTGPVRVTVQVATEPTDRTKVGAGPAKGPRPPIIPRRYTDADESELTLAVKRGSQTYDIDLTP
ncbi:MAG: hypothetical protein JWO38_3344 [Gemmataceae bacterium]|nr:hypothetical protein [Gemmataceae bacterium]